MRRIAIRAILLATLAACVVGAAAGLGGLLGGGLGAGEAAVVACDTNGLSSSFTTVAGQVTAVTMGGLADPACEGAALSVTLANGADAAIGSGGPQTVPTDGDAADNSVAVPMTPAPGATLVAKLHVAIEGP